MQRDNIRLTYLDCIRGIAALAVVFSHFEERTPLHSLDLFKYFTPGQFGVVVFFMLSGFVIPFSFHEGAGKIRAFLVSRIFRLYPAYWFSLCLACICYFYILKVNLSLWQITENITMLQTLLGEKDLFGIYWTLFIELVFYALCAVLSASGLLGSLKVLFFAAISTLLLSLAGAACRFYFAIPVPVGVFSSISLMFFGAVWRSHVVERVPQAKIYSLIWGILFLTTFPPIAWFAYNFDRGLGESAFSYIGSYFVAFLFFILTTTILRLRGRSLAFLGAISFSMYLVHPFFLEWICQIIEMKRGFSVVGFLSYLGATIALATLSYFLIERRFINVGRRINRMFNSKSNPPADSPALSE
ncbi:MAG: acyltransferase family protein [Pseudomonas sp.]